MAEPSKVRTRERWETEFQSGKWDFLKRPEEQGRLKKVCKMILEAMPSEQIFHLMDLGSGEGLLADHMIDALGEEGVARLGHYVPVDIAQAALDGIGVKPVAVTRLRASLRELNAAKAVKPEDQANVQWVIVANEVLTYDGDSVAQLDRICRDVAEYSIKEPIVVVSCVGPHPCKPNWTAASEKLWSELVDAGWPTVSMAEVKDEESGVKWDLAVYHHQI